MNKLTISPPALTLSPASRSDPEASPRLIVLFPASETDTPTLSHQIWEIARSQKLNVLLVSLSNDFEEKAELRRKLITLAAIIKDPYISTDIMIEHGNNWVRQVRKIWQAGDVVACFADQKVGLLRKPLNQVLRSSLEATIVTLPDYQPVRNPNAKWIAQASSWLGSLTILGGFLWAEVKIIQLPQDWAHNILIFACVFVEIAVIWVWNLLFA
jgi:hypothetical protein